MADQIIPDSLPEGVLDAVAEALGDAYDCTRCWSAWHVGTMSSADFVPVADDGDCVAEIALAAITAWEASKPQPAPAIDMEKIRVLAQGAMDTLAQNETFPADVATAVGHMRRLLDLIGGQANLQASLNEQFGITEELRTAIRGFIAASWMPSKDESTEEMRVTYSYWHKRLVKAVGAMGYVEAEEIAMQPTKGEGVAGG